MNSEAAMPAGNSCCDITPFLKVAVIEGQIRDTGNKKGDSEEGEPSVGAGRSHLNRETESLGNS